MQPFQVFGNQEVVATEANCFNLICYYTFDEKFALLSTKFTEPLLRTNFTVLKKKTEICFKTLHL